MAKDHKQDDDDSFVWGAANIGKLIGRNQRQTFYLLEKGLIPARKVNTLWVTTRRLARSILPNIEAE